MAEISIVIPAYNAEQYIRETIRSVQRQTFSNYVCIVVDDGFIDETEKILRNTIDSDRRFIIVKQKNSGECSARNTGIAYVSTPYVAVLDSDDIWHPRF